MRSPATASGGPGLADRLTRWLVEHPAIELGILFGSVSHVPYSFA